MKIIGEETVIRYHVEYDEEETRLLKITGFLPPYATVPACLWSTKEEIESTERLVAEAREFGANPRMS